MSLPIHTINSLQQEQGKPILTTDDHRVSNDVERKRILAIGGRIKDERLFGQLALSRSFGDCPYSSFLSVEPHIFTVQLNKQYHRYLIVASDGVWDFVGDEMGRMSGR